MDFGKVADSSGIDFSLKPDHPFNNNVLPGTRVAKPQVYVGCPIWANKPWLGKIYPASAKDKDYLRLYTRQFNTIELNTTHYRIPDPETIERWKEASAPGFQFCPKWPQIISHEKQLQGVDSLVEAFCLAIAGLGDHLGMSFLQLPPYFQPRSLPILEQFIKQVPPAIPLSVEFRHEHWFSDASIWQETVEMLSHYNVSTVITDVAGRRDVLHQSLTTRTAVIRYVGNVPDPTDYRRLAGWADRVESWLAQGLEKVYFFVHEHDNIISPEVVRQFVRELNKRADLQLAEPKLLVQAVQGSLF